MGIIKSALAQQQAEWWITKNKRLLFYMTPILHFADYYKLDKSKKIISYVIRVYVIPDGV